MGNNHQSSKAEKQHKTAQPNLAWLWVVVGIGIIAVVALIFQSPRGSTSTEISVPQAYEKYQQGAFILDVRTQQEWDEEHIAMSVLIPLDQLPSRLNEVPKDQDIVVVCRSGRRSKEGMTLLRGAGYSQVSSMAGGLIDWKATGYPLDKGAP
jgi:rhodanese-related sulfurtransferase